MADRFIREAECVHTTGLSRSTIWRLERANKFPKRRSLSPNAVGWLESEVQEWIRAVAEREVREWVSPGGFVVET